MKIRMISTKKVIEVEKCYGMRLIEQGKAVLEHHTQNAKSIEKAKEEGVRSKKADGTCR